MNLGFSGIEDGVGSIKLNLLIDEAEKFVKLTKGRCFSSCNGTNHGAYKFKKHQFVIDIISEVKKTPSSLVMHGSSSVPVHLIDIINRKQLSMQWVFQYVPFRSNKGR